MVNFTNNFNFELIDFNRSPWHEREHNNWHLADALLSRYINTQNVQGVWTNATAVSEGERWVDPDSDTLWEVAVPHTTASSGTFAADRTANPGNWTGVSVNQSSVGTWTSGTAYTVNDFVIDQTGGQNRYGVVVNDYTAGNSYDDDVTAGNIITLIDLTLTALAGSALAFDPDEDTDIIASTDDVLRIRTGGTERIRFTNSTIELSSQIDLDGNKLILTPDGVSSIHGESNGQIDIEIAGADDFQLTANTFSALSGSSIVANSGATIRQVDGIMFIGDTANSKMTLGLTINQGDNDDEAFATKSSDVDHSYTDIEETDTYFALRKLSGVNGGADIRGFGDASIGLELGGHPETEDTSDTSASVASVMIRGWKLNANDRTGSSATANVAAIAGGNTVLWLIKGNGDVHGADTDGAVALDVLDDIPALHSIDLHNKERFPDKSKPNPSRFDNNRYTGDDLERLGFCGPIDTEGNRIWNKTMIESATRGGLWQQREMFDALIDVLEQSDVSFRNKFRAELVKRSLPTQIVDWDGPIP